jgi:hypothetical protein
VHTAFQERDFTRSALTADGYRGWTTFSAIRPGGLATVDPEGGTYMVLRVTDDAPRFLKASPAGHFKGIDQTVPLAQLRANWVDRACVLYIGKGNNLDVRLRAMAAFGAGKATAHRGGRLIWQLKESPSLLVAWRSVRPGFTPKTDEDDMIECFRQAYGKPPFANYPDRLGRSQVPTRPASRSGRATACRLRPP